jgi:hypothetical protein
MQPGWIADQTGSLLRSNRVSPQKPEVRPIWAIFGGYSVVSDIPECVGRYPRKGHLLAEQTHLFAEQTHSFGINTRSSGRIVRSSGRIVRSSGRIARSSGRIARSSGGITRISGGITRISGGITRISGACLKVCGRIASGSAGVSESLCFGRGESESPANGLPHPSLGRRLQEKGVLAS